MAKCVTCIAAANQGRHILVSSEVSAQTAFPRTLWRVGVWKWWGWVYGRDVLGKAVCAETEPRSAAEPYIEQCSDYIL